MVRKHFDTGEGTTGGSMDGLDAVGPGPQQEKDMAQTGGSVDGLDAVGPQQGKDIPQTPYVQDEQEMSQIINSLQKEQEKMSPLGNPGNELKEKSSPAVGYTREATKDYFRGSLSFIPNEKDPSDPLREKDLANSYGGKLVRLDFNPSHSGHVDIVKTAHARAINSIYYLQSGAEGFGRWKSIALTELETAAMYAVKAVTAK